MEKIGTSFRRSVRSFADNQPLLSVDRPSDSLTQWETGYRGIRKALAHQAITERGSGRMGVVRLKISGRSGANQVTTLNWTTRRLVHTHCARRHPDDQAQDPDQ